MKSPSKLKFGKPPLAEKKQGKKDAFESEELVKPKK